jgi:hypothetical protein
MYNFLVTGGDLNHGSPWAMVLNAARAAKS